MGSCCTSCTCARTRTCACTADVEHHRCIDPASSPVINQQIKELFNGPPCVGRIITFLFQLVCFLHLCCVIIFATLCVSCCSTDGVRRAAAPRCVELVEQATLHFALYHLYNAEKQVHKHHIWILLFSISNRHTAAVFFVLDFDTVSHALIYSYMHCICI